MVFENWLILHTVVEAAARTRIMVEAAARTRIFIATVSEA
jgi:hypothetical protein